jgi:hypothetical protein
VHFYEEPLVPVLSIKIRMVLVPHKNGTLDPVLVWFLKK